MVERVMGEIPVPGPRSQALVDGAVARLCQEVVDEPLCFFSEADLQAMMYMRLRKLFPDPVPLSEPRGPNAKTRFLTSQHPCSDSGLRPPESWIISIACEMG
jgi:hypothetical protein